MFRLIVFDLDGTLVDSRADLARAANRLIAEHRGAALGRERIVAMVGEGVELLVRRVLAAAGIDPVPPDAVARFLQIYDEALVVETRPYPGVVGALEGLLPHAPLAVLTNKPRRESVLILERLDLARFFSDVFGGDGPAARRKPHPDGLSQLIARFESTPADTLLVGDSAIDLRTARAAGTHICLARYGFGFSSVPVEDLRGDELFVDAPAELVGLVNQQPWPAG
jgi:phosphoglycolate phosphatase